MSVQHYEGGDTALSAPAEKDLGNNRKAISQIIEEGQKRKKLEN